jgi:outer membrane protein TolC
MWTQGKKTGFKIQDSGFGHRRLPSCTVFRIPYSISIILLTVSFLLNTVSVFAGDLNLQTLIDEALKNNPEIRASEARASASRYKIPQAESLPDPMFMFGYQNEGLKKYNYGKSSDAQWMFSASQMFPFPGKLSLKGEMTSKDAESLTASHNSVKLKIIARIKELYYDLFFAHKNIELIKERASLFSRVEDAAIARYQSGKGSQQEVLMAQTEKYMLIEKEEMLKQKIQSIEAMLNTAAGRDVNSLLGKPETPIPVVYNRNMNELLKISLENSPEIKVREKMVASAEVRVKIAEKEYYPDFTLAASLFERRGDFEDMWSLTTTINIPLFYRTKQKQAVYEAVSSLSEARNELQSIKLMISSAARDNYSMLKTAERLMELYKNGLIPRTYQDVELALAGFITGKVEALTVITKLKSLIDLEILYWGQFMEREKAMARLEAITGIKVSEK